MATRKSRNQLSSLVFRNVLQWSFLLTCVISIVMFVSIHPSAIVVMDVETRPLLMFSTKNRRRHQEHSQQRRVLRAVQLVDMNKLDTVQPQASFSSSSSNKTSHYPYTHRVVSKLGKTIDYSYQEPESVPEGCEPLADWQTLRHFACNKFHEVDMVPDSVKFINWGAYREVYRILDYDGKQYALKVLTLEEDFDKNYMEKHRKDALAFELLSFSPHVANMYGACMNSAVFDFAEGGDLRDLRESGQLFNLTEYQRLEIARDAAMAVADFHIASPKRPNMVTMFHGDVKDNQFILIDGRYRFNDFNIAHFVSFHPTTNTTCPYKRGSAPGKWRSPEEYRIEHLTEKIDVWSLGVVLSCILTGEEPYDPMRSEQVSLLVRNGGRIHVTDAEILNSNHIFHKSMLHAMDMTLVHDPNERATARQVAEYLDAAVKSMEDNDPMSLVNEV